MRKSAWIENRRSAGVARRTSRGGYGYATACVLLASLMLVSACGIIRPLRQRREAVQPSGFLGDYSQLQKNEGYPAYLTYINPEADWSKYDAIQIDSVTLWADPETAKLSSEDRQMLTGMMYNALHDTLSKNFKIVDTNGPNVLRVRAALTEAKGAKVALNAVTTVIPQLRVLATVGGLAGDTAKLVGEASAEAELVDSVTGVRLAAAVDRETGTKGIMRAFSKWADVQDACNYWAGRLDKFLVKQGVQQKPAE